MSDLSIYEQVQRDGAMPLSRFMELAIAQYYANRQAFGASGDFVTAPEISQMFGEMIGAWIIDVWQQMGCPQFDLIECGPGQGTLMADLMRVGKSVDGFVGKVQIRFIEASQRLRDIQAVALDEYDVTFHDTLLDVQTNSPCIVLGNEFLDALPIEQLMRTEKGWRQRFVVIKGDALAFEWGDVEGDLLDLLPSKTQSQQIYEISPARDKFIGQCGDLISRNLGASLFIDYGYIESHYSDTLQVVRGHSYGDVLSDVGASDMTSHVDFDALSRRLLKSNLSVSKCVTQGRFLCSLGIDVRAKALSAVAKDKEQALKVDSGLHRLTHKDEMGDLFKVICFYKGEITPAGFETS